jgi:hypothetical protein
MGTAYANVQACDNANNTLVDFSVIPSVEDKHLCQGDPLFSMSCSDVIRVSGSFTLFSLHTCMTLMSRVSFETSFDSKQPKLESKLVSALSETKRLFRLFRFYSETASFGVSVKPKLTETNRNKLKTRPSASAFCP